MPAWRVYVKRCTGTAAASAAVAASTACTALTAQARVLVHSAASEQLHKSVTEALHTKALQKPLISPLRPGDAVLIRSANQLYCSTISSSSSVR
jgi:hypothetical protein